jgi:hypothetical protein
MRKLKHHYLKIALCLLVVGGLYYGVAGAEPLGTTFAHHGSGEPLELTIDSYSIYNGEYQADLSWELKDLVPGVDRFFNFPDVKPGDTGQHRLGLHVDGSPAYACLYFMN